MRRLNLLQTVIEHARREWRLQLVVNPAQQVKRPAGADKKRDRVFAPPPEDPNEQSEEQRLYAGCYENSQLLGDWARFAVMAAMRQGEIAGLWWEDIDLKRRVARVLGAKRKVPKNGDVREVPLSPEAVALLMRRPGVRRGAVFPMDQNILRMRYRRVCDDLGIVNLTFHDLRHVATTRLAKKYPNPLDLMRVTGHKDLKSLDRYYHKSAEELAAQAA